MRAFSESNRNRGQIKWPEISQKGVRKKWRTMIECRAFKMKLSFCSCICALQFICEKSLTKGPPLVVERLGAAALPLLLRLLLLPSAKRLCSLPCLLLAFIPCKAGLEGCCCDSLHRLFQSFPSSGSAAVQPPGESAHPLTTYPSLRGRPRSSSAYSVSHSEPNGYFTSTSC